LKAVSDAQGFVQMLDLMAAELTNDFWAITLPADLESSSARNPQLFAYLAAQKRLNTPVLFSHKKVGELIDPALAEQEEGAGTPPSFPRAWLEKTGITDLKLVNQMANQALLGWLDNIAIGDSPPRSTYRDSEAVRRERMEDRKISTRSLSDKEEKATETVLEQAEALSHAWAVEAFGARTACGRANVSLCWRGGGAPC
jgi:hypothetical protein